MIIRLDKSTFSLGSSLRSYEKPASFRETVDPGRPFSDNELLAAWLILVHKYSYEYEWPEGLEINDSTRTGALAGVCGRLLSAIPSNDQCLQFCIDYTPGNAGLFTLSVRRDGLQLSLEILYDASIDVEIVKKIPGHYRNILNQLDNDRAIGDINILTDDEYNKIVYEWNNTAAPYPKDKTIQQLFEEQVEKNPDNIAVVFEDKKLTYCELNEKVNQLAHTIRNEYRTQWAEEIRGDTLIGIYIERSLEMIIGILAILKSGGAYVPFDSADPEDRLKFKIADSGCKLVLTSSKSIDSLLFLTEMDTLPLSIDGYAGEISRASPTNPVHINKATDLAYVIYTSGSTGKPKGVMIEHRSVINYRENIISYTLTGGIKTDYSTNLAFDLSITTSLVPLLTGDSVCIYNGNTTDISSYNFHLQQNKIEKVKLPTDYFVAVAEQISCDNLKEIIIGGSAFKSDVPEKFKGKVIDEYGPTETTVGATFIKLDERNKGIGKPYYNYKCYILDKNLKILPAGVEGELYIGGDGLARGYLNRLELTAERFISNPFATMEDKVAGGNLRLYKTGDLCRWLPDGNIEYIGRTDFQVKIRGYRVELGEIENKLSSFFGIMQCVVVCLEKQGNKFLAAYYSSERKINDSDLKKHLAGLLPEYMMPSAFIHLDELPLNSSGKIDRKRLPLPEFKAEDSEYVPPAAEDESELCNIWKEILGSDKIGVNDDFFSLGGNSISAIKIAHRIATLKKIECNAVDVIKCRTVSGLCSFIRSAQVSAECEIPEHELTNKLSVMQKLIVFDQLASGCDNNYNEHITIDLPAGVDKTGLQKALQKFIDSNEQIRMFLKDYESYEIAENISFDIEEKEISDSKNPEDSFRRELQKVLSIPFDLFSPPLFSIYLFTLPDNSRKLVFIIHHITEDAASINDIFIPFIASAIGLLPEFTLPKSRSYREHVYLEEKKTSSQSSLEYWEKLIGNIDTCRTELFSSQESVNPEGKSTVMYLDEGLSGALRKFGAEEQYSLYVVTLSVFYLLLANYSRNETFIIGSVASNRRQGFENTFGCFLDKLFFVINRKKNTFKELLKEVDSQLINNLGFNFNYPEIIKLFKRKTGADFKPNIEFSWDPGALKDCKLKYSQSDVLPFNVKNELYFEFDSSGDGSYFARIEYRTDTFTDSQIQQLIDSYKYLLMQVIVNPSAMVGDYNPLTDEEQNKILYKFNDTSSCYPKDRTIHQLFEEQAERTPGKTALVFENKKLTYRELNERANQLAHTIRSEYKTHWGVEVKPDTLIGIYIERGLEMIIGMLAILKAGGAYVPFDPADPEERLRYKISDSACKLIVTSSRSIENLLFLTESDTLPLSIDGYAGEISRHSKSNPVSINTSGDLAYVIYTSGSTGKPKGIMVEHNGVINLCYFNREAFGITQATKALEFSSVNFDAHVYEVFPVLSFGGTVLICSDSERMDPDKLSSCVELNKINLATLTPSFLSYLEPGRIKSLKHLVVAGEVCNIEVMQNIASSTHLVNAYGPTESTVCTTQFDFKAGEKNTNIGKPIANKKCYILDSGLKPVPVGVPGELYISGDGLARGYLNRPELTKEKFILNPFDDAETEEDDNRMYSTGDLCKWLPDGNMEFLGRTDFQIKIRGFRIEPGEIESVMTGYNGVTQAVVVTTVKKGNKHLIGYYTSQKDVRINNNDFKEYLSRKLPGYMIPVHLECIDSIPLNTSGKVDRNRLPEVDFSVNVIEYISPRNGLEAKLCQIWGDILHIGRVGIRDDFFCLGGDSILGIQLCSRMRKVGFEVGIKDIFCHRTIERISEAMDISRRKAVVTEEGELYGEFEYLPVQSWFMGSRIRNKNHFNHSFLIRINEEVDKDRLKNALDGLNRQHDILRAVYKGKRQRYRRKSPVKPIKELDVRGRSEEEISRKLTTWQSCFDIEKGYIWQAGILRGFDDGSERIFFAAHHLVIDAVSWRIICEDLKKLYHNQQLVPKTSSYRQWVETVINYGKNIPAEEKNYWSELETKKVKYSRKLQAGRDAEINLTEIEFDTETTRKLLQDSCKAYNTEINDLLLSALSLALKEVTGEDRNMITLEGHGREAINDEIDVSHTVGWFTIMYPVCLNADNNLRETIIANKEMMRKIPNRGIGYGVLYGYEKLPKVVFNYLGQIGDIAKKDWEITGEQSGENISGWDSGGSIISINGVAIEGKLKFSVNSCLEKKKHTRLCQVFKGRIEKIVVHCREITAAGDHEKTASDFVYAGISQATYERLTRKYGNNIEAIYRANSLQEGFIYHSVMYPDDDAYHVQAVFDYESELNVENYRKAWMKAAARYPALRIRFDWEDEMLQVILKPESCGLDIFEHDISGIHNQDEAIKSIQIEDREKRFDLQKDNLLRIHVIRRGDAKYSIIKSEHHAISDGWSGPVLMNFVHDLYYSINDGKDTQIDEETTYKSAQEYYSKNRKKSGEFWRNALSGVNNANDIGCWLDKKDKALEIDSLRKIQKTGTSTIELTGKEYARIRETARDYGVTVNVLLQYAWHKLIHTYTRDEITVVGTTVAGRAIDIPEIEQSVGLYINTLPIVVNWCDNTKTLAAKLDEIQDEINGSNLNSFEKLSGMRTSNERLFHSLLVFENYPVPEDSIKNRERPDCLKIHPRYYVEKLDYPFAIIAYEKNGTLTVNLDYDKDLTSREKAEELLERMKLILVQAGEKKTGLESGMQIVSPAEYKKIVYEWNSAETPYPMDRTIHQLFQKQVEKSLDNTAVVFEDRKLTYSELDSLTDYISDAIGGHDIRPEEIVPIIIDRSFNICSGGLAVNKAGGAFVFIDPKLPEDRKKLLLNDYHSRIVLCDNKYASEIKEYGIKIVITFEDLISGWMKVKGYKSVKTHRSSSADLFAIITTSGSTGTPKGSMIEHRNFSNFATYYNSLLETSPGDQVASYASFSFDVSVATNFAPLLCGATVHILSEEVRMDVNKLNEYFIRNGITCTFLPTPIGELYIKEIQDSPLNVMAIGGEQMSGYWKRNYRIVNAYAPSECTVAVLMGDIDEKYSGRIPLGRVQPNNKVYIFDKSLNVLPAGVPGELYIGGVQVGRGYYNRPELNNEKFIQNEMFGRLYRSGDLAKWTDDGQVVYLGRIDQQVKLHGYRIELEEIENVMSGFQGILQAVVTAKEKNGNKYLAGYYTETVENGKLKIENEKQKTAEDRTLMANDNGQRVNEGRSCRVDKEKLREYLTGKLPDYMVPAYLVQLEKMPLNTNGKVDRRKLPEPELDIPENLFISPGNQDEILVAAIWQDVLKLDKISMNWNFFSIGGNSILAIKLAYQLGKTARRTVPVSLVFSNPTIEQQAKLISDQGLVSSVPDQIHKDMLLVNGLKPDSFPQTPSGRNTAFLTGVTGFLGVHLLEKLLTETDKNVICLVRKRKDESVWDTLKNTLRNYCIEMDEDKLGRVDVVSGDLEKECLGIDKDIFEKLKDTITDIYHCGAYVNHLLNYEALRKSNVLSVVEMIKLISACNHRINVNFISTTGTVSETNSEGKGVEEGTFKSMPVDNGYCRTKWCAEYLMKKAFDLGLNGMVFRPGNIFADTRTGITNPPGTNHFLMLTELIIKYEKAPILNSLYEFVPVDILAEAIIKISGDGQLNRTFLNMSNPYEVPMHIYTGILERVLNRHIELVPFGEWKKQVIDQISVDSRFLSLKSLFESAYDDGVVSYDTTNADKALKKHGIGYPDDYYKLIKDAFEKYLLREFKLSE